MWPTVVLFLTGRIDITEIKQSLAELGLDITKEDAEKILKRYLLSFCSSSCDHGTLEYCCL